MKKFFIDDGFQNQLVSGASFSEESGIPELLRIGEIPTPNKLISFVKCKRSNDRRGFVHFYVHDIYFSNLIVNIQRYLPLLQTFDGVISPDPSILVGQSRCLQQTNVYFNRAIAFFLQNHGITVIPNVRWGDSSTYSFCFQGIPRHSVIAIGTHGCMKDPFLRKIFSDGLKEMLKTLEPSKIIVYGAMPDNVFGPYLGKYTFIRYPSDFETTHKKRRS